MGATPQLYIHMEVVGADFDKLLDGFEDAVHEGMQELAKRLEDTWRDKAQSVLNTSRQQYLDGLSVEYIDGTVQATLSGFIPVAIEEGVDRYDMKPGLLGSGLSKVIPIGAREGKPDFRTMSQSHPEKWWHPGIQARAIHKQVQEEVGDNLKHEIFDELFSKVTV